MYIVASFIQNLAVELALSEMEEAGIPKEQILAVPLNEHKDKVRLFDTMHHADGHSLIDLALVLGCIFMLLGAIYGFVLTLGPILWALIGLVAGSLLGFTIKLLVLKRQHVRQWNDKFRTKGTRELVLMIKCTEPQIKQVTDILWNHHALGVGLLPEHGS
jgi:hypothetical protein